MLFVHVKYTEQHEKRDIQFTLKLCACTNINNYIYVGGMGTATTTRPLVLILKFEFMKLLFHTHLFKLEIPIVDVSK